MTALDLSTRRKRLRLALSMAIPIRCGGMTWRNGAAYYMIGGKYLSPKEFSDYKEGLRVNQLAEIARFDNLTDEEVEKLYPEVPVP